MTLVFLHGWSVRDTATYGAFPQRLRQELCAAGVEVDVEHVFLGKYVSFDDEVTMDDLAQALDAALRDKLTDSRTGAVRPFACITHSTGGVIARLWLRLFHARRESRCPMTHLVTLAAPHHGSALAQLGKSRLSRLKFFFDGVEPGERILDGLELGSDLNWELARADREQPLPRPWVFSLVGQTIDRKLYDHLNSYTGEAGSDGVVRAASANLNYQHLVFEQQGARLGLAAHARSARRAFGVLPGLAHGGRAKGIMTSVTMDGPHPALEWTLRCLLVSNDADYTRVADDLEQATRATQEAEIVEHVPRITGVHKYANPPHGMIVFRLLDHNGTALSDYELLLTAGPHYSADDFPQGFCRDRQRNRRSPAALTFFLNHGVLGPALPSALEGRFGFQVLARPDRGLAYYEAAELRSDPGVAEQWLRPNETTLVEVVLQRRLNHRVLELVRAPERPGFIEKIAA